MSNLVKFEKDLFLKKYENNIELKPIVKAILNFPKISTLEERFLFDKVKLLYDKQIAYSGQKTAQKEGVSMLQALFIEIVSFLKSKFSNLTFEEIEIACENGRRGEYGEWFGINPDTIYKWIKSYCKNENTANIKLEIQKESQLKTQFVPGEKELIQARKYLMKSVFIHLKIYDNFKNINLPLGLIYDYLLENKLIIPTGEEFKNALDLAIKDLKYENRLQASRLNEINEIEKFIYIPKNTIINIRVAGEIKSFTKQEYIEQLNENLKNMYDKIIIIAKVNIMIFKYKDLSHEELDNYIITINNM
jgi:hypothetical protein